jgi:hypothetical protein
VNPAPGRGQYQASLISLNNLGSQPPEETSPGLPRRWAATMFSTPGKAGASDARPVGRALGPDRGLFPHVHRKIMT